MIKAIQNEVDRLDDSILAHNNPGKSDVIGIVKIALQVLLIILQVLVKTTLNEKRRVKYKRWIEWIQTGTIITAIIKP